MRLLTTRAERRIHMAYAPRPVPRSAVIAFPLIVTIVIGVLVPASAPFIASLMLGALLKESDVVERLANTAANELTNISTLFLGLTVGSLMQAASFLQFQTLVILSLGLGAFVLDTVFGILFGKLLAVLTRGAINPLVWRRRHQRIPDERPAGAEDRTGGRLHQSRADARDGRQHGGSAWIGDRRRGGAGAGDVSAGKVKHVSRQRQPGHPTP